MSFDLQKCGHVGIGEICKQRLNFFVPAYQRGYRWRESQIMQLINDIIKYDEKHDGKYYCLQPVVVRYDNEASRWRVIDGQQRLTTIWLILKLLGVGDTFSLSYHRNDCLPTDFNNLKVINTTEEQYRLTVACRTITELLKNIDKEVLLERLLNKVEIIWYPVEGDTTYEHKLFLNLNSGKIPLCDAELIKALLFHDICRGSSQERTLSQTAMAQQWDIMEKTLRRGSFWHFIAGREAIPVCAMDYFLDVHYRTYATAEEMDEYNNNEFPVFSWIENRLDKGEIWDEILTTFDRLQGWYDDTECYNLIGYHMSVADDVRKEAGVARKNKLAELLRLMNDKVTTAYQFKSRLWCSAINDGALISDKDKAKILSNSSEGLELFDYRYDKNYNNVLRILSLVNISQYTIGGLKRRFEFEKFNDPEHPWNVEHISPQNPKNNEELFRVLDSVDSWLPDEIQTLLGYLRYIDSTNERDFTSLKALSNEERVTFEQIKEKILPFNDSDVIMTLPNLTLLTEHENKSIGNRFFFEKRQKLQQKQEEGHYIPQATWNVFTKWHSSDAKSPLFWEESDREAYKSSIAKLLKRVLEFIKINYGNESEATPE